jgi:hypothetical protein
MDLRSALLSTRANISELKALKKYVLMQLTGGICD